MLLWSLIWKKTHTSLGIKHEGWRRVSRTLEWGAGAIWWYFGIWNEFDNMGALKTLYKLMPSFLELPYLFFYKCLDKNQSYTFCWFINSNYFFSLMGGSKNKSPAQKEKKQKKGGAEDKKTDKSHKEKRVVHDTVNINESKAANYIKNSKVITIHGLARETNVKISIANTYIKKSVQDGILKRTSGFSGHRIYQPVSK